MKSSSGSSNLDYIGELRCYSATYYNSLHIEYVPFWMEKDSSLRIQNSEVDHYNTHKNVENKLVLHTLTADSFSGVVKSKRSTEHRA